MMKELVVRDITEPMRILKKCAFWCIQMFKNQSYGCATKFRQKTGLVKGLYFGPNIEFSTMTVLQKALPIKPILAQKPITEMEHPSNSPDLATRINFALKERKFQEM
jgi:hypothetical protein